MRKWTAFAAAYISHSSLTKSRQRARCPDGHDHRVLLRSTQSPCCISCGPSNVCCAHGHEPGSSSVRRFQGAASRRARLRSDCGALHADAVHVFALEAQHL